VKIVIGSDAHSTKGLAYTFGIAQARRGWLEKEDVLNTLPLKEFLKIVKKNP
jgi:DNA polymerase (family 10)